MYIYDDYRIIDNFDILKNVSDIIGEEKYSELLSVWDKKSRNELEKVCGNICEGWGRSFIEALFVTSPIAKSLIEDDLFGIYIGIVPSSKFKDDTEMPVYFIFRCSNNGRSVVVSEIEI